MREKGREGERREGGREKREGGRVGKTRGNVLP